MKSSANEALTFIDLFCGCGGFTLGLERSGFRCLAAIDFNEEAIKAFKANLPNDILALRKDLTTFTPAKLAAKLGVNHVDVIVGGPPCQGFSNVRQVDAANHGRRVRRDKRRYLFRAFLDYVAAFRPRVFVMENVVGIQSAAKGKFLTLVQAEARRLGYRVQAQVEEAWKLGVPQSRRRRLFIGVRDDIAGYFPGELCPADRVKDHIEIKLWDAIGDLPALAAGSGEEEQDYDFIGRSTHFAERGEAARHYLEDILEVRRAAKLTAHRARPHSERDLRDFARLREGEHSGEAEGRGEKMEFLYKRTCFEDRYKRQHRERVCSTIVAHLSKDGLGFIHPTQSRSLTPREAARVQSFPDWFDFPVARTHQFRLIGNAVPPLVAEAIGEELRAFLDERVTNQSAVVKRADDGLIAQSQAEAAVRLQEIAKLDRAELRSCEKGTFLRGWFALFYLFPGLHPDNALDHGESIELWSEAQLPLPGLHDFAVRRYARSGWPAALELLGREAWRRYERHELNEDEFYCSEAQRAGMRHRDKSAASRISPNDRSSLRSTTEQVQTVL